VGVGGGGGGGGGVRALRAATVRDHLMNPAAIRRLWRYSSIAVSISA